tara:strand:+ start:3588 stop:4802 length:1215 start_codon:yes stop_codon:yes gene_type:complete
MGKKSKNKINQPLVSICTPTFNRRPFIPSLIKCIEAQTYPKNKIEWIIVDDGTDKIEDIIKDKQKDGILADISDVKYIKFDTKMVLGKKRNIMHEHAKGDIIVYMDDDDFYPPERVQHAVDMLQSHPTALCAGASEIYIYFKHINQMVQFGPYGPNHATAGTFAFKKELLKDHRYNDTAALAEEKEFLNNYTVPFVQLEPKKTILVFSHPHNTFDKKTLLDNRHPNFVKNSDKTVDDFVKDKVLKKFYMEDIEDLLKDYEPGKPSMKPDVLSQIQKITKEREELIKQKTNEMQNQQLAMYKNLRDMGLTDEHIMHLKNNPHELMGLIQETQMLISKNQMLLQLLYSSGPSSGQIIGEINGEQQPLNNQQIVNILKEQRSHIERLEKERTENQELVRSLLQKLKS